MFHRFGTRAAGNMSIMMMAVMAVLALIIGGVIDYTSLGNEKRSLQNVADGAALAAAREIMVARASDERVQAVSDSYVAANFNGPGVKNTASIVEKGRAVKVSVSAAPRVFFPGPIGANAKAVHASATAEIEGGGNVCMVGLNQMAPSTLDMKDSARLTADGCAIYSNSKSSASLHLADLARVKANLICVAGGVSGATSAATPAPVEDCPALSDPLRDRPQPRVSLLKCDYLATVVPVLVHVTLHPGVYCGGIAVLGGTATLEPGLYTMNNGLLTVGLGGTLKGENVGFFLTGALSTIMFDYDSHIDLTAPMTGDMAGLMFFEDRKTIFSTYHTIRSKDARRLVGTMYFPNSKLMIEARNPVADKSEYTVIIAKEFELRDGPELVLKTDYGASPIPLPDGVGNKAHPTVRLTR